MLSNVYYYNSNCFTWLLLKLYFFYSKLNNNNKNEIIIKWFNHQMVQSSNYSIIKYLYTSWNVPWNKILFCCTLFHQKNQFCCFPPGKSLINMIIIWLVHVFLNVIIIMLFYWLKLIDLMYVQQQNVIKTKVSLDQQD